MALSFFISCITIAQEPVQYHVKGLEVYLHPELKQYGRQFSHVCQLNDGKRYYAVLGTYDGTVFVDYTDNVLEPADIQFFSGAQSIWRECRSYNDPKSGNAYAYVVTEGGGRGDEAKPGVPFFKPELPGGIQIFKIGKTGIELVSTYVDKFNSAHTIFIDRQRGLAFVNGSRWTGPRPVAGHEGHGAPIDHSEHLGGMRVLDIAADPELPRDLGGFGDARSGPYTHDSYALGEMEVFVQRKIAENKYAMFKEKQYLVYSADIYKGFIRVVNFNDPANPVEENSVQTPLYNQGISVHNVWVSEDKKWLFATEETRGSSLLVYSLADPRKPRFVTAYRSELVSNDSIIHNVVVKGNIAFCSWYMEGLRLVDISNPVHPKEIAFFDSSTRTFQPGWPFHGNWSVDVDDRGLIMISDIEEGLFILRRTQ